MLNRTIKIKEFSDSHLNQRSLNVSETCDGLLRTLFKDEEDMMTTDVVFCPGDITDKEATGGSPELKVITAFYRRLVDLAAKYDFIIRVSEGTPSHDRGQGYLINRCVHDHPDAPNVRYVADMEIEYISALDIHVLYIPDEYSPTCLETQNKVTALLAKHGLTQVDFTLMHGMFEYQMPPGITLDCHDINFYSSITLYDVYCGHIHQSSQVGNVVVAGSTVRFSHGEERPKGLWECKIAPEGVVYRKFIENIYAKVYVDVNVAGLELKDALNVLTGAAMDYPEGSSIRMRFNAGDNVGQCLNTIRKTFFNHTWVSKKIATDEEKVSSVNAPSLKKDITVTDMTANNLTSVLKEAIEKKHEGRWSDTHTAILEEHI